MRLTESKFRSNPLLSLGVKLQPLSLPISPHTPVFERRIPIRGFYVPAQKLFTKGNLIMDWRHNAVCRGEDPELFFPVGNSGPALAQIAKAKLVCNRCPVSSQCLSWYRVRPGRWCVGWHVRGRAPCPEAPQQPRPYPHSHSPEPLITDLAAMADKL